MGLKSLGGRDHSATALDVSMGSSEMECPGHRPRYRNVCRADRFMRTMMIDANGTFRDGTTIG